jgi:hypothetical protein
VDTPHIATPLRVRGGRPVAVEQDSEAHVMQRAYVILATPEGTFEAQPELGLADRIGESGPLAPAVVEQLARWLGTDRRLLVAEDLDSLATRVRRVRVSAAPTEEG